MGVVFKKTSLESPGAQSRELAGAVAAIIALLAVVNARLGFKPLLAIAALLLVPLVVVKGGGIVDDDYSAKAAAQASDAATAPSSK